MVGDTKKFFFFSHTQLILSWWQDIEQSSIVIIIILVAVIAILQSFAADPKLLQSLSVVCLLGELVEMTGAKGQ